MRGSPSGLKKPDLPQNESCGRLDREQAGLKSESRAPLVVMKPTRRKMTAQALREILPAVRTSNSGWPPVSLDSITADFAPS